MSKKKYGINETKEVLLFGYQGFSTVKEAKENDGEIDWKDLRLIFPMFALANDAFEGTDQIKVELLDLDDTEQAELIELTKGFYSHLDDQQCIILIEKTVNYVIDGFQLVLEWTDINKSQAA